MSKQEQLELAELLPADGSAISFQSDAYGQLRSTKGICTASTQYIHQRISMQKITLETSQKRIAIMLQSISKWTLLYFVKNGMDGGTQQPIAVTDLM